MKHKLTFIKNTWYNYTNYAINVVSQVDDKIVYFMMILKKLIITMYNMFEKKLLDLSYMTNTMTNIANNIIERNVVDYIMWSKLCMNTITQHLTFVQHFIIKYSIYWYNTVVLVYLIQILN